MDGHRFLGFEGRQPPGIVVGPARIATRSRIVIPSLARVERTLSVDIAYTTLRMRVLERLAGNRLGIAYRWIDATAVALMSRLPAFCRVIGLRAGHEPHIGPLVRSYRDHDGKPTFEIGARTLPSEPGAGTATTRVVPFRVSRRTRRRAANWRGGDGGDGG